VPRSALTKVGAGETAVWVHTEAERFVAAACAISRWMPPTSPSDGLHEGDRVVVEGAGLLSQCN
jgi:hypothetical protein